MLDCSLSNMSRYHQFAIDFYDADENEFVVLLIILLLAFINKLVVDQDGGE